MRLKRFIFIFAALTLGLLGWLLSVSHATGPSITINIDAAANRHAINPNIYGVAFATSGATQRSECAA